jgi:hypothetical protein
MTTPTETTRSLVVANRTASPRLLLDETGLGDDWHSMAVPPARRLG